MVSIGEVKCVQDGIKDSRRSYEFDWKISNFLSLRGEADTFYSSPSFLFMGESFFLKMVPNGLLNVAAVGYIGLYLHHQKKNHFVSPLMNLEFSLGLKTFTGKKWVEHHRVHSFTGNCPTSGVHKMYFRSDIFFEKENFKPTTDITVFCSFKYPDLAESVVTTLEELENYIITDFSAVKENGDDGSLCEDFKKMLQDGINHDLVLKIGDKEIKAHKDVLRARSQVFKSMLEHDMKEKNSGIIDMSDCDPQAMEVFLSYVYCGKVDVLNENNMIQLYYIADKYEMIGLKNKCCIFIKQSLSPTNFCDIIQLAFNHSDSNLFDFASEYFKNNVLYVLRTVEWLSFMKDNSALANVLLIKSHENKM